MPKMYVVRWPSLREIYIETDDENIVEGFLGLNKNRPKNQDAWFIIKIQCAHNITVETDSDALAETLGERGADLEDVGANFKAQTEKVTVMVRKRRKGAYVGGKAKSP